MNWERLYLILIVTMVTSKVKYKQNTSESNTEQDRIHFWIFSTQQKFKSYVCLLHYLHKVQRLQKIPIIIIV